MGTDFELGERRVWFSAQYESKLKLYTRADKERQRSRERKILDVRKRQRGSHIERDIRKGTEEEVRKILYCNMYLPRESGLPYVYIAPVIVNSSTLYENISHEIYL